MSKITSDGLTRSDRIFYYSCTRMATKWAMLGRCIVMYWC